MTDSRGQMAEDRWQMSDGRVYWATAFAVSEGISKKHHKKKQKRCRIYISCTFSICLLSYRFFDFTERKGCKSVKLSLDGDDFTTIKIKIYLTWQPLRMISVLLPGLGLHICKLVQFVIFHNITSFFKRNFFHLFSISVSQKFLVSWWDNQRNAVNLGPVWLLNH